MATSTAKGTRREAERPAINQIVTVIAVIAILYFAREVLIPLAFALIVAFLLTPIVTALERIGLRRVPAVVIAVLVMTAAGGFAGWVIANQLVEVVTELPKYRANIDDKIQIFEKSSKGGLSRAAESLAAISQELSQPGPETPKNGALNPDGTRPIPVQMVQPGSNQFSTIWSVAQPSLEKLAAAGIVLVFTIFILIEKEDLRNRILRLAGISQLNLMTEALDDAGHRVSRYLLMQLSVNSTFGLVTGVGLYAIGVPYFVLWGVVAGILRLVPYVGIIMAAAMPFALSLAVFNSWLQPLLVFLLFAAIELVTSNFAEPMLYGTHTGISSLAILVTTVFWASLWGPPGLILATPLTVCLVVLGRYIPQLSFLYVLLGDQPVLTPAAQLYQRLLAMDQQDARAVVDLYRKTGSVLQLYDEVLIPALSLAEHDRHRGALDSAREEFLFLNINEMVAEFAEDAAAEAAASENEREAPAGRVFSVAAHDQADEIAGAMLAQLLEHQGFIALCFPAGPDSEDMIGVLEPGPHDLVFISALQPYAFTPARAVARRIRARFPKVRLVAGIWGFTGDPKKALGRFERTPPDQLVTNLAQALEYAEQPGAAIPGATTPTENAAPLRP